MNMDLRYKLKRVDIVTSKLGYIVEPYGKTMYLSKTNEFDDMGIESYIRLYMHKKSVGNGKYIVFFTAEPCKLPGGSDYMDLHLANDVCNYWKKVLRVAEELTALNIVGTQEEIIECVEDIAKKRRR